MSVRAGGGRLALYAAVSAAAHAPLLLLPAWSPAPLSARPITLAGLVRSSAAPPPAGKETVTPPPAVPALARGTTYEAPPPAPPAAAPADYEFGALAGPRIAGKFSPAYPLKFRKLGREGRVVLRLTIGEDGRLLAREVLQSSAPEFLAAVEKELAAARFAPARDGGRPVACRAVLPVTFRLEK